MSYINEGFKVSYIGKNEHRNLFIRDKHYGHVAEVFPGYGPGEEKALKERDQIGAMFTAAPEMLEALEVVQKYLDGEYNPIDGELDSLVQNAIRKAKGQ